MFAEFWNDDDAAAPERKAMCQWLIAAGATGYIVQPERWFLTKVEQTHDRVTLEFQHSDSHEMTMTVPTFDGVRLIEHSSYSVTVANREFDMNCGDVIVKRNTYTGSAPKLHSAPEVESSYHSSDPNWGAW